VELDRGGYSGEISAREI